MDNSTIALFISSISLLISVTAFYLPYRKAVISSIQFELTEKAKECNKFINTLSQGHPINTQEVSAVVTEIINAKGQLALSYNDHSLLLLGYDEKSFVKYFFLKLHSSIRELIKNPLPGNVNDKTLRPIIEQQQLTCRLFFNDILK